MTPSRRHVPSIRASLTAAALTLLLGHPTPVHAQASPDCFKVCSNLFYKNVNAVMKCAYKGRADATIAAECGAKAGAKMQKNYVQKPQSKCGDLTCVAAYPSTNDVGCETIVFSTAYGGYQYFGLDPATQNAILAAGISGCGY